MNPIECLVAGFLIQFLQDTQAGVATGVDHVIGFARTAGDNQWLIHAIGTNRGLNAVVFRILAAPRIAVIGPDARDLYVHRCGRVSHSGLPGLGWRRGWFRYLVGAAFTHLMRHIQPVPLPHRRISPDT